jgi:hypothetical protein
METSSFVHYRNDANVLFLHRMTWPSLTINLSRFIFRLRGRQRGEQEQEREGTSLTSISETRAGGQLHLDSPDHANDGAWGIELRDYRTQLFVGHSNS